MPGIGRVRRGAACRPAAARGESASGRAICSARSPAYRSRRAASAAGGWRGRCGSRWNARRCRASRASPPAGRPCVSCRRPAQSVQGCSMTTAASKATSASSAAMRRIVAGGDAAALGDRVGRVWRVEIALGEQVKDGHARVRPSGSVNSPTQRGRDARPCRPAGAAPASRSQASGRPRASRANSPSSARAGIADHQPGARWCSGRGTRDRCDRRAAARGPARARTARRCPAAGRSIRRRSRNSRSSPD